VSKAIRRPDEFWSWVEQNAAENNIRAMQLRDQGKFSAAKKVLRDNEKYLLDNADRYQSKRLRSWGQAQRRDADNLRPNKWKMQRKVMRETQFDMMH